MAQSISITKHAVAGSSKLAATTSGRIYNIIAAADMDNGCIVGKGDFVSDESYKKAAATTFTGKIIEQAANGNFYVEVATASNAYLVLTAPLVYQTATSAFAAENTFYNEKGSKMRAYELMPSDIFELSVEGFDGTPVVGKTVSVSADKVKVGA